MTMSIVWAVAIFVAMSVPDKSHALTTNEDCALLKALVADAETGFQSHRAAEHSKSDISDDYVPTKSFSSARRCLIIEGKKWFNQNVSCELPTARLDQASRFVQACLGAAVRLDQEASRDHMHIYRFTKPAAGAILLWQPGGALHVTVDRADPNG